MRETRKETGISPDHKTREQPNAVPGLRLGREAAPVNDR